MSLKGRAESVIRNFGMSTFLISDDLKGVERRYNIELGHGLDHQQQEEDYYPQFEQAVRAEAARMSRHYETFYCLERSIRKLIVDTLEESEKSNWWTSGRIPEALVKDVDQRIQREVDSGVSRRSDDHIEYTTFGELSNIITSNWDLFGSIFTSRRAVEKVLASLNLLRAPIAHCCPISEDEVDRLQLTVKDWFRMLG